MTEVLVHWYAGRSKLELSASLGMDRKTVRKYIAPAQAEGLIPGGPPIGREDWAARVRAWFPELADSRLRQPTWSDLARHHDYIASMLGILPMNAIHQVLRDKNTA